MQPTRRDLLVTIAAITASSQSEAQTAFLNPAELTWLKAVTDAIIPRTDTPGASDAGGPASIKKRLAANPNLADTFRAGMKKLDADGQSRFGAAFPALTSSQQID